MNKRKAKRFTFKTPFTKLIIYVDTDDVEVIERLKKEWVKHFRWWKFNRYPL